MISKTTIKTGVILGVIQEVVLPGYEPLCGTIYPRRGVADALDCGNLRGSRRRGERVVSAQQQGATGLDDRLKDLLPIFEAHKNRLLPTAQSGNVQVPEWTVRTFVSPKCRKFHAMAVLETKQRMGDKLQVHAAVAERPAAIDTPALTYHIAEVGAKWLKNIAGSAGKELLQFAVDMIPLPGIHAAAKKVKGMAGELCVLAGVDNALLDSVLAAIKTNLVFVEERGVLENVEKQNAICRDILRNMEAMFRQSCQFGKIRRFLLERDLETIQDDQRENIAEQIAKMHGAFSTATKDTDATHDEAAELSSLRIEKNKDFDTFRGALEALVDAVQAATQAATREGSKWGHYMNHGLGVVADMGFNTGGCWVTQKVEGPDGVTVEEREWDATSGDRNEHFDDNLTWLQIATTLLDSCHKYEARRDQKGTSCGQKVIIYAELLDAFIVSTLMQLLPDAVQIITTGNSRHAAASTCDLVNQLKIDLQTNLDPATGRLASFSPPREIGEMAKFAFLSCPTWRAISCNALGTRMLVPLEKSYRDEHEAANRILKARLKSLMEENSRLTKENAGLQLASRLTKENVSSNDDLSTRSTSAGSSRVSSWASTPSGDPGRPEQPGKEQNSAGPRRGSAAALEREAEEYLEQQMASVTQARETNRRAGETDTETEARILMAKQSALEKLVQEQGIRAE